MKVFLLLACAVYATQAHWVKEMENNGLFQGDMELTPDQMLEADQGKFTFGSIKTGLWTKVGSRVTIPYSTDSKMAESAQAMTALKAAFADYAKYTCIEFVPRTDERAYIYFRGVGNGCSSPVGMTGRMNRITLSSGCWSRSTIIHEIGHSLGLHHEQSRPDRDSYIKVRWENIPKGIAYNFKKQSTDRVDSRGTKYDYRSVMHYGKTAFGSGKVTMQTTDPYFADLIGIGSGFSDIDVVQINKMYSCPKYEGVVEAVKQTPDCRDTSSYCEMMILEEADGCDSWAGPQCPFLCKKCTPGKGWKCADHNKRCADWKIICPTNKNVQKNCPLTCGLCKLGEFIDRIVR